MDGPAGAHTWSALTGVVGDSTEPLYLPGIRSDGIWALGLAFGGSQRGCLMFSLKGSQASHNLVPRQTWQTRKSENCLGGGSFRQPLDQIRGFGMQKLTCWKCLLCNSKEAPAKLLGLQFPNSWSPAASKGCDTSCRAALSSTNTVKPDVLNYLFKNHKRIWKVERGMWREIPGKFGGGGGPNGR